MQNNLENDEKDLFSEMFRQKLENHQLESNDAGWKEIEAWLKSKKRGIIPFWYWVSSGAAVAGFALFFMLRPLTESRVTIGKGRVSTIGQVPERKTQIAKNQKQEIVQSKKTASKREKGIESTPGSYVENTVELNAPVTQKAYSESIDSSKTTKNYQYSSTENENKTVQNSRGQKDTVYETLRNVPNSLVEEPVNEPIAKNKTKSGWLVAASLGSHGGILTGNDKYNLATGNKNIVSATVFRLKSMTAVDFSNILYSPPVAVGVVLRKNLSKSIGLESGLVYTYMLTSFENSVAQQNDAKLHLHYVGVPLNMIAQLWNHPRWEIYASGGGMLEKGIRSVYVQNQYTGNQTLTTTTINSIDGVQWSVNGAIGTTYKFQRNLGIFFEPKIAYYFDNNQPISARTKYPVVIGLTAGVRFQFK